MALIHIKTDGTETGLSASDKINLSFTQSDSNTARLDDVEFKSDTNETDIISLTARADTTEKQLQKVQELGTDVDTLILPGIYEVDTNLPNAETLGDLEIVKTFSVNTIEQNLTASSGRFYSRTSLLGDGSDWTGWVESIITAAISDLDARVTINEADIDNVEIISLANETKIDALVAGTQAVEKTSFPTTTTPTLTEGQIGYDGVNKQFVAKDDISDATLNIGHEMWIKVYNSSGVTITNGQVLKQIGVQSGYPAVGLSQADTFANASVVGVATHDILNGEFGNAATQGSVGDFPTANVVVGDTLFLSDTVAGGVTNVLPPIGTIIGTVLTDNGATGNVYVAPRSLLTLPPVGGWMKAIPTTIDPGAGYNQFSGFTDVSTSAGITGDGVTGIFSIDNSGTYEISLSASFSGITPQNNGSIITVELYNVNGAVSLFEYNIIVGRNDTVASGTLITQGDFTDSGQLVARYKETSGNVGTTVSVDNISFLIKSILIR